MRLVCGRRSILGNESPSERKETPTIEPEIQRRNEHDLPSFSTNLPTHGETDGQSDPPTNSRDRLFLSYAFHATPLESCESETE